jgi:hypothetical protein
MKVKVLSTKPAPSFLRRIIGQVFSRPAHAVNVKRREIPYWRERGWKQEGNTFHGTFQTGFGSFIGRVEQVQQGNFRLYILDPPQELRKHSHWSCFQPQGDGRSFRVHLSRMPKDVSSAILAIERLLTEAFEGK